MSALVELVCGDTPAAWARLGFAVGGDGVVRVGAVAVRLDGRGGGLRSWVLAGAGPGEVGGVPTAWVPARPAGTAPPAAAPAAAAGGPAHPNGAVALDHVVLLTGDVSRSVAALEAAGGDVRRRAAPPAVPVPMAFVRLGPAIVEVATGGAPPRLWGLVAEVADLDALADGLGPDLLGTIRAAVQPGRRIATVRAGAGLGTAVAFLSPRVRAPAG